MQNPKLKLAGLSLCLAFMSGQAVAQTCGGVTDGLVACYLFEGNADDSSGNGNHGTAQSGVSFVAGQIGQAAQFAGNNQSYIRIPNPAQKFTKEFTVTGWISANNDADMFAKYTWGAAGGGGKGFTFSTVDLENISPTGIAITTAVLHNTSDDPGWPVFEPISPQQYYYISTTYSHGNAKIYINGDLQVEKDILNPTSLDNNYDMLIGTHFHNDGTTIANFGWYSGIVDELRVYNRALSAGEIQSLYLPDNFTLSKAGDGYSTARAKAAEDSGWTINCKANCEQEVHDFALGSEMVLVAYKQPGSEFEKWECSNGLSSTSSYFTFTLDRPTTCVATVNLLVNDPQYPTFTGQAIGTGSGTLSIGTTSLGAQGKINYSVGKHIWVKAIAASSFSKFKEWSGDCSGTSVQTKVIMTGPKTCYAEFTSVSAEESNDIVEALYQDQNFAADYPKANNEACLQEAVGYSMNAMLHTQAHLQTMGTWPSQFNDTEWYSPAPINSCTQSVKMIGGAQGNYLQVQVSLVNASGASESVNLQAVPPMDGNNAVPDWLWQY